jgi:nitroreductase
MAVTNEKSVFEAIQYRRSVSAFKKEPLDDSKVKKCIELATIGTTSNTTEGFDSLRVKKNVNLPPVTEITMFFGLLH